MNCLNAAYSGPQLIPNWYKNFKISIKIYLYYSNEVWGVFFSFFHFHFKEIFGFWVFFKCWYSSQRQTKKSSEEQLPGISSFVRTSFSRSVISNSATLWTAACQASLSFTVSWSLFKLMSIQWCYLKISSFVTFFSSCPLSFPTSGSFPVSQLFTSGGQSIGASASASIPPMNIQDWLPLGLTGLISLQCKGLCCSPGLTLKSAYCSWHLTPPCLLLSNTYLLRPSYVPVD